MNAFVAAAYVTLAIGAVYYIRRGAKIRAGASACWAQFCAEQNAQYEAEMEQIDHIAQEAIRQAEQVDACWAQFHAEQDAQYQAEMEQFDWDEEFEDDYVSAEEQDERDRYDQECEEADLREQRFLASEDAPDDNWRYDHLGTDPL